jgi:hypothetical protein
MKANLITLFLLSGLAATGCSGSMEENLVDDESGEELATTAQALLAGAWTSPPANRAVVGFAGGVGPLRVCRGSFDNGEHPGKLWDGTCNVGWGGTTLYFDNYELLQDQGYVWQDASAGLPANAVDGGDSGDGGGHTRMGVCQAFDGRDGTWHPGKFFAGNCNYAWGGSRTDGLGVEIAAAPGRGTVFVLVAR